MKSMPKDTAEAEYRPVTSPQPAELPTPQRRSAIAGLNGPRTMVPVRPKPVIPQEVEGSFTQLYYAIEARRTNDLPMVVQFIAPAPGAGVTTVAAGYARAVAAGTLESVLYVDCNPDAGGARGRSHAKPTLFDTYRQGAPLADAIVAEKQESNLYWARLGMSGLTWNLRGVDHCQTLMEELRATHSVVVLDSPPATNPDAASLSRYSDGTVLVVEAGRTYHAEIERAKSAIERLGGQIVGVVLNREKQILGRW